MYQYRQVLVRMRQGDSDREIARARLMGRPKAAAVRAVALDHGWLDVDRAIAGRRGSLAAVCQAHHGRAARSRRWSRMARADRALDRRQGVRASRSTLR